MKLQKVGISLSFISFIAVIVMIAFTADPGIAEEFQKRSPKEFSMERLEKILNKPELNYWKEIKKHVTKPCMKYFAEWEVKLSKNTRLYKNLEQQKFDEMIDGSIYLAVSTLQKSKFERDIYDAVADEDQEMRMLYYALFLGKCKREVVRFSIRNSQQQR